MREGLHWTTAERGIVFDLFREQLLLGEGEEVQPEAGTRRGASQSRGEGFFHHRRRNLEMPFSSRFWLGCYNRVGGDFRV
jgi:hypothetical protein